MDGRNFSISKEEAERIKKKAAEEYDKLRESLRSSADIADNSNSRRSYQMSQVSEAERIRENASAIFAELRESVGGRGPTNSAVEAINVREINFAGNSNHRVRVSRSGSIEQNDVDAREERNVCQGARSHMEVSGGSNAVAVDSPVKKSGQNCCALNSEAIGGSDHPYRREVVVQLKRDVPTVVIDYNNPVPSTSSNLNFASHCPVSNSRKSTSQKDRNDLCSDFVGRLSETAISNSNGESEEQRKDVLASEGTDSNSWDNFISHLIAVKGNVNLVELFIGDDVVFFNVFIGLPMQAQAVFINLLNMEYTWYRESSLVLPNMIHELKEVVDTLIEKQLLIVDPGDEEIEVFVKMLTVQELKNVCKMSGLRDDGRKEVLKRSLIDFAKKQKVMDKAVGQTFRDLVKEEILKVSGRVFKLSHTPRELFLRTQLLYALPLTYKMTEDGRVSLISIMNDVSDGKITYPDYTSGPLQKLFPSRESLIRFQQALHLEANIKYRLKLKDYVEVTHLYESAIIQLQEELRDEHACEWSAHLPNFLRAFTRGSVLARAVHRSIESLRVKKMTMEMISAYETLLRQDLYLKSCKGRWYDQLANIYQNVMKDVSKTVIFLMEALADPSLNEFDRVLLSERASPIVCGRKRKRSQLFDEIKPMLTKLNDIQEISVEARCFDAKIEKEKKFSYIYETIAGVGQILSTPEEVIMLHFKGLGYNHGIHSSSAIGTSIFGILCWDIIYKTEVPNVFLCPYQSFPLDLLFGEFYTNRESQIKTRIAQIKELWSEEELYSHVHETWSKEEGKKSVVSWKIFQDLNQYEVILRCIGRKILAKICEKMAKQFSFLCKTFPSMLLWNETTKSCKFIHVKEANATLTPTQKSWLLTLNTVGGDAFACCVSAVGSKPPKRKPDTADDGAYLDESMEIEFAL